MKAIVDLVAVLSANLENEGTAYRPPKQLSMNKVNPAISDEPLDSESTLIGAVIGRR